MNAEPVANCLNSVRGMRQNCAVTEMVVLCLHVSFNVGDTAAAAADEPRLLNVSVVLTMLSETAAMRSQVAYNALSAGVKAQLPLPPMSPDSAMPASSEPAAIPAARPFDPAQVPSPPPKRSSVQGFQVAALAV